MHALLRTALSAVGHRKVLNIIELVLVLKDIEFALSLLRDPEKYSIVIWGKPDAAEARKLMALLDEAQRRAAVVDSRTYGDIVTANKDKVDPIGNRGLEVRAMTEAQRAQLRRMIEVYADSFEPGTTSTPCGGITTAISGEISCAIATRPRKGPRTGTSRA